jgi:2-keto-3-deoxy-6-phosphogluconate aldolase
MRRIAFDTQVPRQAIQAAESSGHTVVYWAGAEHDELWFRQAMDMGADVFVSPDWDIAILAENHNKKFIRIPQKLGGQELVAFIMKRLLD